LSHIFAQQEVTKLSFAEITYIAALHDRSLFEPAPQPRASMWPLDGQRVLASLVQVQTHPLAKEYASQLEIVLNEMLTHQGTASAKRNDMYILISTYLLVLHQRHRHRQLGRSSALNKHILDVVHLELSQHSPIIAGQAEKALARLIAADTHYEISLLPFFFQQSMQTSIGSSAQILQLGVANVYCWLAYSAYDDILDEDANSQLLSLANITHRQGLWHYQKAILEARHFESIKLAFRTIDEASAWEMSTARCVVRDDMLVLAKIPDYADLKQLANRSFAHVCGPLYLAQLANLGTEQQHALRRAFKHFIIARQLNDDAHDWQKDVRAGRLTYVVVRLLQDLKMTPGSHAFAAFLPAMRQLFWQHQSTAISQLISEHVALARQYFATSQCLTPANKIYDLLDSLENTALRSQALRQKGASFIAQFETML
jgi:hypothetical protein